MPLSASNAFTPKVAPYGFSVAFSSAASAQSVARYVGEIAKAKTAVIMADDSETGKTYLQSMTDELKDKQNQQPAPNPNSGAPPATPSGQTSPQQPQQ